MTSKNKKFDCVKNMRQAREKISEEIADMSHEELVRYFRSHKYSDPFLQKIADDAKRERKHAV